MKPTNNILIGEPLSGTEARFLARLHADLRNSEAIILANFVVGDQQIDFIVLTPTQAALIELKHLSGPASGGQNGRWTLLSPAGRRTVYPGGNPFLQTLKQKYAVSDAMRSYGDADRSVPGPLNKDHYREFAAFVCLYPEIHPQSRLHRGDHRVRIASYVDVLEALRKETAKSSWSQEDWVLFAEKHLGLTRVSIEEATSPEVLQAREALQAYCDRLGTILMTGLGPLISPTGDEPYGSALITRLSAESNFLVLGPAGSAKTFHLHHLACELALSESELPLTIDAGRYTGGDFWPLLRHALAPFCNVDPRILLDAARLSGRRPVVLLDAVNECPEARRADLLRGVQAFVLKFDARIVLTSQEQLDLSAEIQADTIVLAPPVRQQKRAIYAFHASRLPSEDLDAFCEGFTNAYDLAIAGRIHIAGEPAATRLALYDRYVLQSLGAHAATATALLRSVAADMANALMQACSRDTFVRRAEQFLAVHGGSLAVLDFVLQSRLLRVRPDSVAFEHQLLFDYFTAEYLRRQHPNIHDLQQEITRPRNRGLVEFVLPRLTATADAEAVMRALTDERLLATVLTGRCGGIARQLLVDECLALLQRAIDDLPKMRVTFVVAVNENGQHLLDIEVAGSEEWTDRDGLLCALIGRTLGRTSLTAKFLELFDLTTWALNSATTKGVNETGFALAHAWGEVVRLYGGLLDYASVKLPCASILAALRNALMGFAQPRQRCLIQEELAKRAAADPPNAFAMLMLLEDKESAGDVGVALEHLQLAERALETGLYIVQVNALEYLQPLSGVLHSHYPDKIDHVRTLIEAGLGSDPILNSARFETLMSYGGVDTGVSSDDALREMRDAIRADSALDPKLVEVAEALEMSPMECLAEKAYGCIAKLFEDIFGSAYWEAYDSLTGDEKVRLLVLAGRVREFGFMLDWILEEMLKLNDSRALPVFRRFCTDMAPGLTTAQERVAAFVLGLEGCARWSSQWPPYGGGNGPADMAWSAFSRVLFSSFRGGDGTDGGVGWTQLRDDVLLAAGDVLYRLSACEMRLHNRRLGLLAQLGTSYPEELRSIGETCLRYAGTLPSVFLHAEHFQNDVKTFLISLLGKVGTSASMPLLQSLADDPQLGESAIAAISELNAAHLL